MLANGFFTWLGESLGEAIRFIVEVLGGFFAGIGVAAHDFIEGLTGSLGMDTSLFGLIALILGLGLLYKGIRALLQRSFLTGALWMLFGLLVLSWLIA